MKARQEIMRDMEKISGTQGMITETKFAAYMGIKCAYYARKKYLDGLEIIDNKYYFISDVIDRLLERSSMKEARRCGR